MKKIKRLKDIQHEKMRLRIRQLEQEKNLRQDWQVLKQDMKPGNLLRSKLEELTQKEQGDGNLLSGLLHYGADYLSRFTGEKIGSTLHKGVESLAEKLKEKTGGKLNTIR